MWIEFQSTPSGGKATTPVSVVGDQFLVSIHAFRGEGDSRSSSAYRSSARFNPRLPGGRRPGRFACGEPNLLFQSTPSGGKATAPTSASSRCRCVSIHAFRGEGDSSALPRQRRIAVSIHAFRGEGDAAARDLPSTRAVSIHAFRGEGDFCRVCADEVLEVSIHAFRGEGDQVAFRLIVQIREFQSTPSGGKATIPDLRIRRLSLFQSTPSGGKATEAVGREYQLTIVSIHAFRGEGDVSSSAMPMRTQGFNPRLPGGRRHPRGACVTLIGYVSIHAFRGEGDCFGWIIGVRASGFQSTPSGGKATTRHPTLARGSDRFNPRLPGGRRRCWRWLLSWGMMFQSTPSGGKATRRNAASMTRNAFQSTPSGGKATGLALTRVY